MQILQACSKAPAACRLTSLRLAWHQRHPIEREMHGPGEGYGQLPGLMPDRITLKLDIETAALYL